MDTPSNWKITDLERRLLATLDTDVIIGDGLEATAGAFQAIAELSDELAEDHAIQEIMTDQLRALLETIVGKRDQGRPALEGLLRRALPEIVGAADIIVVTREDAKKALGIFNRYYTGNFKDWPEQKSSANLALMQGIGGMIGLIRHQLNIGNLGQSAARYKDKAQTPIQLTVGADNLERRVVGQSAKKLGIEISNFFKELSRMDATDVILQRFLADQGIASEGMLVGDEDDREIRSTLIKYWKQLAELFFRISNYQGPRLREMLEQANLENYLAELESALGIAQMAAEASHEQGVNKKLIEEAIANTRNGMALLGRLG